MHDARAPLRDIVKRSVGSAVNVVIQRDNNELTLRVTVGEWPAASAMSVMPP
jgi:S1-C subfamily serine protease